jgi:hypothetical protein
VHREAAAGAGAECPVEFEDQLLEVRGLYERALNQAGWTGFCSGYIEAKLSLVRFRFVFYAVIYYQQHGPVRFSFVLGSFFPQERIFNNFPASFSGSFLAINVVFPFVINNFLGSFFKKRVFLSHTILVPKSS